MPQKPKLQALAETMGWKVDLHDYDLEVPLTESISEQALKVSVILS